MNKKLYRSESDKAICGVCAGFGRYFGVDPIIVRLLFVLAFLTYGVGLMFYLACAIVIPKEPEGTQWVDVQSYEERGGDYNGSDATHYDGAGGEKTRSDYYSSESFGSEKKESPFESIKNSAGRENLGIALVVIGGYILIRIIFPRIDMKLIIGLIALAAGIYVMRTSKK